MSKEDELKVIEAEANFAVDDNKLYFCTPAFTSKEAEYNLLSDKL